MMDLNIQNPIIILHDTEPIIWTENIDVHISGAVLIAYNTALSSS